MDAVTTTVITLHWGTVCRESALLYTYSRIYAIFVGALARGGGGLGAHGVMVGMRFDRYRSV